MIGVKRTDRTRHFSVVYSDSDRTRENGHKWEHKEFHLNVLKHFFTMQMTGHWHRFPREVSLLGELQKSSGHHSGQTPLGVPA